MGKRDYYEVLGLKRGASADEIRRAYRGLARELHPDVNKAPDAAKKFAEVQEAYETLSDEVKRGQYDRFGHAAPQASRSQAGAEGPFRWSGGTPASEFDMDEIGSVFDAFFGSRYSPGSEGAGSSRGQRGRRAQRQQSVEVSVPFVLAAKGGTQTVRLRHGASGAERTSTLEVQIPPATADGTKLRVKPPGADVAVVLVVRVQPHGLLERVEGSDLDLKIEVPLSVSEAVMGASVRVPTLDGSAALSVPPGSSSGRKLRLRGMGLKDESGKQGDLYAIIRVVVPDGSTLGEAEREAMRAIGLKQGSPRTGAAWPA